MFGSVPEDIVSPRWPYIMLAVSAGLAIVAVAMMLVVGRHLDWTFFAMMLPLEAGLVIWLVSLLAKVARPPALRMTAAGLTLRKGWKQRTWRWCQIDTFYLQPLQIGATVGFRWEADSGGLQGTWLNYPFPGERAAIVDRLTTALAAARQAGAQMPDFSAMPQDARAMARWKRRTYVPLAILGIAFAAVVVDLNTARTALLTPISPVLLGGLELLGGGFGIMVTLGEIGSRHVNRDKPTPTSIMIMTALVFGATFIFVGAALGGYAAWRIGEFAVFSGRQAPLASKNYRIVNFHRAKQAFYAEIEPYPKAGRTRLPVSGDDFARLTAADRQYEASVYCYPVMVQVAGRAIRMVKPNFVGRHEQRITLCPLKTDDDWAS